ncbi:ALBINO3-like protein 2 chloroplastic [Bienertia sinuspersici]
MVSISYPIIVNRDPVPYTKRAVDSNRLINCGYEDYFISMDTVAASKNTTDSAGFPKMIGHSQLPPPFPPLFSGRSFTKQFSIFLRERRALGCPSFLWFLAPWAVQLPCFILCMTSVRRMSLDQYQGFDTGGMLWFQNLTEIPHGPYGPIVPVLIAGLHFCNVQIGFRSSLAAEGEGLFHSLAKLYKMYLEFLTLPVLFIGFHIPQASLLLHSGSLVYWVTNSFLTLIQVGVDHLWPVGTVWDRGMWPVRPQQNRIKNVVIDRIASLINLGVGFTIYLLFRSLTFSAVLGPWWLHCASMQLCLKNPAIRQKLGLREKPGNAAADHEKNVNGSEIPVPDAPKKRKEVSPFDISPLQLVNLAVTYLSAGRNNKALPLVRLAVDKDPECYMAWSVMGQLMLQQNDYDLATEYLECAISKIMSLGKPTDEAIDFLIQASTNAGVAYYQQGKVAESMVHFERLKDMEVPEEPIGKARYYEGLVVYSSFLLKEGRKDEAVKYLRLASEYDPQYSVYLENIENDTDTFVDDLTSSRRADY